LLHGTICCDGTLILLLLLLPLRTLTVRTDGAWLTLVTLATLTAARQQLTVQGYAVGHLEGMGPARSKCRQKQHPVSSKFPNSASSALAALAHAAAIPTLRTG
jgi:hypothetical protein